MAPSGWIFVMIHMGFTAYTPYRSPKYRCNRTIIMGTSHEVNVSDIMHITYESHKFLCDRAINQSVLHEDINNVFTCVSSSSGMIFTTIHMWATNYTSYKSSPQLWCKSNYVHFTWRTENIFAFISASCGLIFVKIWDPVYIAYKIHLQRGIN